MGAIQIEATKNINSWLTEKNTTVDMLVSHKNFCESIIADYAAKTDPDSLALRAAAGAYYNQVAVPTLNANQGAVASNAILNSQTGNPALDSPQGSQIIIATQNLAEQAAAQARAAQASGKTIIAPIDLTFVPSGQNNSEALTNNKSGLLVFGAILVVVFFLTR